MNIPAFRTAFPEFVDTTKYPNEMVSFWVTVAEAQVRQCVWKGLYTQGVNLYVAHELVLASQNNQAAKLGGDPGQQGGIKTQKSVGAMSASYDASSTNEKDAAYWNLTTYGKQYIRLARISGSGPVQL